MSTITVSDDCLISAPVSCSEMKYPILGLNLFFLLVDHKLAEFHSEVGDFSLIEHAMMFMINSA
jgi:hypothetical protein